VACRPKTEPHIRALLVQHTAGGGDVVLGGLQTTRDDSADTTLTAHLLVDGNAATRLEQLVGRLSLEPGIHAVHWHRTNDTERDNRTSATGRFGED
jgi:putative Mg2+ transporter-C (MgtC) family protein